MRLRIGLLILFMFISWLLWGAVADTSLIKLIANPQAYSGKKVRVTGYLHQKNEDSGLYLSKDAADYLVAENAIWVDFSNNLKMEAVSIERKSPDVTIDYFDGKYVEIEGIFNMEKHGHMGAFSGTIEDVSLIRESRKWYEGKKSLWEHNLDGVGGLHPRK
jgi:hypothetical protein